MRVLLLAGGAPNHRALAQRLNAVVPLAAIAVISPPPPRRGISLPARIALATLGFPLRDAWKNLQSHYSRLYPALPDVPVSHHAGVNSASVLALVRDLSPDLVLVSGTDLLRPPIIEAAGRVMNLHTGLSPHVRGGPNCTNWALALGRFELIGNTVMWLDAGIDSGAIIASEQTPLDGRESLRALHLKVMDHAHDLYCRAAQRVASGAPVDAVPQDRLGAGQLFQNRDWTPAAIARAVLNFHLRYGPDRLGAPPPATVPLNG